MNPIEKVKTLRTIRGRLYNFIWGLNGCSRAGLCLSLGLAIYAIGWWLAWGWHVSFLCGWIIAVTAYLVLLGIVILTADATTTRQRVSGMDPQRWPMMLVFILTAYIGTTCVGFILTAVGQRSVGHFRLLLVLSVIAVILSWLLLHSAFGLLYARLYYAKIDRKARVLPEGMRRGFIFPGITDPTYEDFLYVSFTIALTYSMSDVNVTSRIHKRVVVIHSLISFLFLTTILAVVLNAIVTS
ncbi:MAG TPA: DUF1345 domain-containing protein [Desulfomonilaceae bacterium]|nr:DUF1345 domain-containing protein [Desulfomonilaceae bacterium]